LTSNLLYTEEELYVLWGEENEYNYTNIIENFKFTYDRLPPDHPDWATSAPPVDLQTYISFELLDKSYTRYTYEIETVIDIFSRVAGYFSTLYYLLSFFIEPVKQHFQTRIMVKELYSQAETGEALNPHH